MTCSWPGKGGRHPTEVTVLHGRRLVMAVETEDGCRLAESVIKELTGGDRIRTRGLYENFWEFSPTHKIWAGNQPSSPCDWHGSWVLEAAGAGPVQRHDLRGRTRSEVDREAAWRTARNPRLVRSRMPGLGGTRTGRHPKPILDATQDYREAEDELGGFIRECCVCSTEAKVLAAKLLEEYHRPHGEQSHDSETTGGGAYGDGAWEQEDWWADMASRHRPACQ